MANFVSSIPYREIPLIANNDRRVTLTFVDMNDPVPRRTHIFPDGTTFSLAAEGKFVSLTKTGAYDPLTGEAVFTFVPADTSYVIDDERAYYEVDAFYPDGKRYTVLKGELLVSAPRGLNATGTVGISGDEG